MHKFICVYKVTAEGPPDEAVERTAPDGIKLFQVSDESGEMVTKEVEPPEGQLTADLLEVIQEVHRPILEER